LERSLGGGYDVIGDIHGHADALRRLLTKLEYSEVDGVFCHATRKVIFVGDFVDRGPEQREVLRIARAMCDAEVAFAVLGNHEFNAIGWATADGKGGFLREHSEKNTKQHEEFLRQLGDGSLEYNDAIRWFRGLPVWLEYPGLRVVHACWHDPSLVALRSYLDRRNCFTKEGLREALQRGSTAYAAAEILMKGPEQRLPSEIYFEDKDGHRRHEVRLSWWNLDATTFRKAAIGMDDRREELPDVELPLDFRYREKTPVLFGHYWMNGEPALTSSTAACLDFSVVKEGYLTAYRWSGESELLSDNLVYVPAGDQ
jgi:diadenosine tetraphosphatase ApaH/serine/threonine PP2A family protein phosphatase